MKTKLLSLLWLYAFCAGIFCHAPDARALNLTWDGSSSHHWTNSGNWDLGVWPTNGDSLLFPPGPARLTMTNFGTVTKVATNFRAFTFTGSNYLLYSVPLSLTNGLTNAAPIEGTNTIAARLILRANQTWETAGKTVLNLWSNVSLTNLTLTLANDGIVQFDGAILGGASSTIVKTNVGTMDINGAANLTQLTVRDGTLRVDGSYTGGLSISNGATLAGVGSVGAFTTAGTVSPGGTGSGILTVVGTPTFAAGSSLMLDLDGTMPGAEHDQFRVPTPFSLANCTLTILPGYSPLLGDSFVIITNTGAAAFTSTFPARPEGSTQTVNGIQFRISYMGGNGNDVTLTAVGFNASATTRIWDGEGADALWQNALNWSNNVAPAGGQSLLFPAGATPLASSNDFPAGTPFNHIALADAFDLDGNAVTLLGGLAATHPSPLSAAFRPATLYSGALTVRVENAGATLTLGQAQRTNTLSGPLTLQGPGKVLALACFTGTGGVEADGPVDWFGTNNFYAGVTRAAAGSLFRIATPQALGANTAGNDTLIESNATLTTMLAMTNAEPLRLAGTLSAFASHTWTAPITILGSLAVFDTPSGRTSRLAGAISGTNIQAQHTGSGDLCLDTASAVSGTLLNSAGGLGLNGVAPGLNVDLAAGQLGGTGEVRNLTVLTGTVRAGVNGAGTFTCSNLIANPAPFALATNVFDLQGTAANTLRVRGQVQINAFLRISEDSYPQVGVPVLLINNLGGLPVSGIFTGLPEGSAFTLGARHFQITYQGGDGNDVAVTLVSVDATGLTAVWDAGGTNNYWSNPQNWAGDILPSVGDALVFPSSLGGGKSLITNDLPAGAVFDRLIIRNGSGGPALALRGQAIGLLNGVLASNTADTVTIALALQLAGPQTFELAVPPVVFDGGISLNGDLTFGGGANISANLNGGISGSGGLGKTCPGILNVNGPNSFDGAVRLLAGSINVGHATALGLPGGGTFTGAGTTLQLTFPGVLQESFLSITSQIAAVASATIIGTLELPLLFTSVNIAGGQELTLAGSLVGAGSPVFQGGGSVRLTGTNFCIGQVSVQNAALRVDGRSAIGDLDVSSSGLLGGTGTVGRVSIGNNGTLNAGASPGVLNTSNLTLAAGSTFAAELNGTAPGASYDQVRVSGPVSLGGSLLLATGFVPPYGLEFILIDNDGTDAVTGTFNGFPEGSTLTTNGLAFRVSYTGGSGSNDVTLVRLFAPTGVTRTWDGGGANGLWSTAANWVGDVLPAEGDNLVFPVTAARKVNTNDLVAFTGFNAMTIGDGGYILRGAAISLSAGLTVTNGGNPQLFLPVQLGASQTNYVAPGTTFTDFGGFLLGPHTLTCVVDGSLGLSGAVSGTGSFIKSGPGALTMTGSNSYSGLTLVQGGGVTVVQSNGLGTADGGTVIAPGCLVSFNSGLALAEPFTIAGAGGIEAALQFSGGTSVLSGPITVSAENLVSVINVTSGEVRVDGAIDGGGLVKNGAGRLVLNGPNTHTNRTQFNAGTLTINGAQPSSAVQLSTPGVNTPILGGTGTLGRLTTVAGTLSPGSGPGILTVSGSFTNQGLSTNLFELNGPAPGSGHDRLVVNGRVVLNNSPLRLAFGYTPDFGDSFLLIQNNGIDPVAGTFAGLPEAVLVTNGPAVLRLTYMGGDGNDVVLTRIVVPSGVTRTWDGGGANSLWSNPANWSGDVLPVQGDDIVFPGSVAKAPVFDAGTNVTFNSLLFGRAYNVAVATGHSLRLTAGLTTTNASGVIQWRVPTTLLNNQGWHVTSPGATFSVRAPLDLSFATLNHTGPGNLELLGDISGSGGLGANSTGNLLIGGTNTFTGTVAINSGILTILSPDALGSTMGGTFLGTAGRLALNLPSGGASEEPLTWAGRIECVASVTNFWNGPVTLAGSQAAFDTFNAGRLEVNGPVFGSTLQTINSGTLVLNGANSLAGPVRVDGFSRLLVNSPHDAVTFILTNSGQLGGSGPVGPIIALDGVQAEVQPGPADAPGLLQSGSVLLSNSVNLRLEIDGVLPGDEHDQLKVLGTVTLANAGLVFNAGFNPATGLSFRVIDNDGVDPVQGTFANLPQGALLTNGAVVLQISYTGGDGNDVVLTRVTAAPPSFIVPLGLSNGVPVLAGQGVPNAPYVLEATLNLNPPVVWQPVLTNNTDGTGWYQFMDLGATNFPMRFYRVVSPF